MIRYKRVDNFHFGGQSGNVGPYQASSFIRKHFYSWLSAVEYW